MTSVETTTFRPRKTRYAIIIGVRDEGERFSGQLARMLAVPDCPDIIIADGGSSDGSTAPEKIGPRVQALIVDRRKQGLSGQYRAALAYGLAQGYEGLIMIDGNGKDGVEAIPRFVQALDERIDLVQGSRFLPGGSHLNTPFTRTLGMRLIFSPMIFLGCGTWYSDGMNGFKGVSRKLLEHPGMQPFRDKFTGYTLQYYINYRTPRLGLTVKEIPVARDYPENAAPPTKIHGLRAHVSILKQLCMTCAGCYNP